MAPLADNSDFAWTGLDQRAVDTARVLAADAVEKVGNGHPGTAMSLAPAAYLIFQQHLRHDPSDPAWIGRDRFVLSPGHTSLTLYTQLFLSGYGLEIEDLESLRTWGAKTPGHPEFGHTAGVEITTGPLGQGLASAVGFAYGQRRMRGMMDADAPAGTSPFDHTVWVIASDGDLQEGVTSEASSLAGHQELGNLVVVYDENHISIEDDTDVAFTENVLGRYESYGWHTQRVDWTKTGNYVEDLAELDAALRAAKAETYRPSIISLRTIIGWPSPTKADTGGIHGSKLGAEEVAGLKKVLGFDPEESFAIDAEVLDHARSVQDRGTEDRAAWQVGFDAWSAANPENAALLDRLESGELPAGWDENLPVFEAGKDVATRSASGKVINAVAGVLPELWGGSADLAGSNNTTIEGAASFIPESRSTDYLEGQPVRPRPALRHPRARRCLDRQRHHPGLPDARLLGHLPDLLRLPAPGHPPLGTDGRPVDLRLDPRLHRPGRGRTDAPAGRAARFAARHPEPRRRPPGGCQRGLLRVEEDPGNHLQPGRHRAFPPEPAGLRP